MKLTGESSPTAICGHSLGGRIALQYAHTLCAAKDSTYTDTDTTQQLIEPPKHTFVLDSVPGQADPSVHDVLRAISSLPTPIPSKSWLVDTLVTDYNMNKAIAMWIATNLRDNGENAFDWIFDIQIANELVENFTDQNFVQMIHDVTHSTTTDEEEDDDMRRCTSEVHLVMAGKNKHWSEEIVSELQAIPSYDDAFRMHTLEKAGHWVHVDDVNGLLELMVKGLQDYKNYNSQQHNRRT